MIHARKIVTVTASDHRFELAIDGETVGIVTRTTTSEIQRYKAYATRPAPAGTVGGPAERSSYGPDGDSSDATSSATLVISSPGSMLTTAAADQPSGTLH